MLIGEKIYYGTEVLFAGINWDTTIGVTGGRIHKIALQTMSMDKDDINHKFRHTLNYLFTQIGTIVNIVSYQENMLGIPSMEISGLIK